MTWPEATGAALAVTSVVRGVPARVARTAHRVLSVGGDLLAAVIARDDSPEFSAYWTRPATSFDAEDAPGHIGRVFDAVTVYPWDAPLVTLPSSAAIRDS